MIPRLLLAAALAGGPAAAARAEGAPPGGAPGDPAAGAGAQRDTGWVSMPEGDVFDPLLADPKQPQSHASALWAWTSSGSELVGAVAYGESIGLARWPGAQPRDGVQLGISGAVFAQFNLRQASVPLVNADYTIGVPLTIRRGRSSARVRFYHQSSHLGDEFLLAREPERVELSFEAFELIGARNFGGLRPYLGGEIMMHRSPSSLPVAVWHVGLDYRHERRFPIGSRAEGQLVAGADAKRSWSSARVADVSLRAGVELGPRVHDHAWRRRWSVLAQFHEGGSPYGQFYAERASFLGVGVHFIL